MENNADVHYAYCEPITASGSSPWHIRRLGAKGMCLSGGADTKALCGREVAWDVNCPVQEPFAPCDCKVCVDILLAERMMQSPIDLTRFNSRCCDVPVPDEDQA